MKKHLFLTALVLALVMCFSCGALAADIISEEGNPNQYKVTDALQAYEGTDLWIGTMAEWIADDNKVYTNAAGQKTLFDNGEAIHKDDIVIKNGDIAIVLAVGTRNPWGYPAGSILDAGYCVDGDAARDNVWAIELLMDRWDSWKPETCGVVTFDIAEYDFDGDGTNEAAVKVSRIHKERGPVFTVDTYYSLGKIADENVVYMFSEITNTATEGEAITLENDIAITNKGDDGAYMVNGTSTHIAGNYGNKEGQKFSTFVLDPEPTEEDWTTNALARDKGSVGYKELCHKISYAPGYTHTVKHYAVIDDEASTKAVLNVQNELEGYGQNDLGTYKIKSDPNAVVVVENAAGAVVGWFLCDNNGEATVKLPKGDYNAFVECAGYAPGTAVTLEASEWKIGWFGIPYWNEVTNNVSRGEELEKITLNLKDDKGNAIFGRVEVPGAYPTVRFCGDSVFLDYVTETDAKGTVDVYVAPGEFEVVVYGEGFWFYSDPKAVTGDTTAADFNPVIDVEIPMVYDAPEGYLSADLHHHANKNDAFADPADAIPSLMASGLDVGYITDHDFTVNNYKAYELAQAYGMEGFLPSEEITASWAHFNVLPLTMDSYEYFLDKNQENHIMDQFSELPAFVAQTHEKEAAITANHPWYSYGLFTNKATAPGGYTDDYDNVELNACDTPASLMKTVLSGTQLWTAFITGEEDDFFGEVNKPHYLVGGSDTHDVLYPGFADENYNNTLRSSTDYVSGKVRTFAYVGDIAENNVVANGLAYSNAVVDGQAFTTFGPLLHPDQLPGMLYEGDKFALEVEVESLENIEDIVVLSNLGTDTYTNNAVELPCINAKSKFAVGEKTATLDLEADVKDGEFGWFAILVVDEFGSFAISNPYWVMNLPFTDMEDDDYFYEAVVWAYFNGITTGTTATTFGPDASCTRAQAVTLLWRAAGCPEVDEDVVNPFTDLDEEDYYYNAVLWAIEEGITNGTSATTFAPDLVASRAHMVTFLYRYAGEPAMTGVENPFTDVEADDYFYNAVLWAVGEEITNGITATTFEPDTTCNRAHAVTFIYRMFA